MKKILLFSAMLSALTLTSCNDDIESPDAGTYPDTVLFAYTHLVDAEAIDGDDSDDDATEAKYYFESDSGQKLFMADNVMIGDYDFVDGQRAVIYVSIIEDYSKDDKLEGAQYGCDKGMRLFGIRRVFTSENKEFATEEEEKEFADHALAYIYNSISYTNNHINLVAGLKADNIEDVRLYVVENIFEDPKSEEEGYLNLELRYDRATEESIGLTHEEYVSVNIEKYAERLKDMKGVILRVITMNSGTLSIKIDTTTDDDDAKAASVAKMAGDRL